MFFLHNTHTSFHKISQPLFLSIYLIYFLEFLFMNSSFALLTPSLIFSNFLMVSIILNKISVRFNRLCWDNTLYINNAPTYITTHGLNLLTIYSTSLTFLFSVFSNKSISVSFAILHSLILFFDLPSLFSRDDLGFPFSLYLIQQDYFLSAFSELQSYYFEILILPLLQDFG